MTEEQAAPEPAEDTPAQEEQPAATPPQASAPKQDAPPAPSQPATPDPEPEQDATGSGEEPEDQSAKPVKPSGDDGTFTQADVDKLMAKVRRETRERTAAKFSDYEDLKARSDQLTQIEREKLDEIERAKVETQEAVEARQTAEQERDDALEKAKTMLIKASFVAEAAVAGVLNPDDAFVLADRSEVEVDEDDGTVSGVKEAVAALVEAGRLPMKEQPKLKAPNLNEGAGTPDKPADQPLYAKLTQDQLEVATKLGLSPEEYAKGLAQPQ